MKKFTTKDLVDFGNMLLSDERVNSGPVGEGDLDIFLQEKRNNDQALTFGQKAVGLNFNPSGDDAVADCKQIFADAIDQLDTFRSSSQEPEHKRLASIAITEAQSAQMWAVKALTWKS